MGFKSQHRLGIFLFMTVSRPAPGPTQLLIQWVPRTVSLEVKHLNLVPQSRMHRAVPPLPHTPSWRGAQLKHRDNFTFTLYVSPSCGSLWRTLVKDQV
jgi:hypothetical protein